MGRKRKPHESGSKIPKAEFATDRAKRPAEERFPADEKVSYRFGMCDDGGDWPWSWDAIASHLSKLTDFETKTWPEITTTGTVGAKRIPTANLDTPAQARLRKIKRDDTDALWELRMGGKLRFWGQRHGSCMCFIWWDPDHTVCPSRR